MITSSTDITAEELKERLSKGETPIIIDVRLDDLEEYKDQEVIVHCRSGARSANAKAFLQQQGFSNVRNMLGGILAYNS